MTNIGRPILIVAGGTGGHIYPAIAVAERLREQDVATVWLGSRTGMETRIVPSCGIRLLTIAISGIRGRGALRWFLAPFAVTIALAQALVAVIRVRPGVVLGMGGFASGPGGLAAWLCRRPLIVHEQNAIPGLTNRLLSHIATRVLQGFPGAFPPERHAVTVGNPVRASIVSVAPPTARDIRSDPFRVLIVGGSRGARVLNESLPRAISSLGAAAISVRHQCGEGHYDATRAAYAGSPAEVRVAEFIDDMAAAYSWASIVVCRAGALTVCELAAAGAASILVPFPHAVDDHQTANAQFLVDADAALLVSEGPDFEQRLTAALQRLCDDRRELEHLAANAQALAIPDAADAVAGYCLELLDG